MADSPSGKGSSSSSAEGFSSESRSSQEKVRKRENVKRENVKKSMSREQASSGKKENNPKGNSKSSACNVICGIRKNVKDNFILLLIIFSFGVLIIFKYYEEKYAHESYFEDRDTFDYYEVLKCKKGDDVQKIKKNYRDLSKKYHPDSNQNCTDCEKKFQEITKAYKTLSDPLLKEAYDNSKGKTFKLIESNTLNLNERNYAELVEKSNDFWVIQIYSDTDSLCLSFSKIWEECYDKYKDILKFGRINVLTSKKLIKQKIPFNVKIFPTVFILAPDGSYQLYPNIFSSSTKDFQQFLLDVYPNFIHDIYAYNKRVEKERNEKLHYYIDNHHSIILLTNKTKLGLAVKHVSYVFKNMYKTYNLKYSDIEHIKNDAVKNSIIDTLKKMSVKKDAYIKENEKWDYFLLVDNANVKMIRRISPTNILHVYSDSLRNNFVGIDSQNVDKTCASVGSRHTYCYVIFINNLKEKDSLDLLKNAYKHLNNSFVDFTAKLDKEAIDEQFFIQPAYILKRNLTGKFKKFIQEKSLDKYNAFFLDYSSNTYATIDEIKNLSDYADQKDESAFLKKIYKDIEILTFQKIPDYCLPFNVNCLFNTKNTFSYKLYSAILKITKSQIILSTVITYFFSPSFKQFGRVKYGVLTLVVLAFIFIMNIRNFASIFSS